MLSKILSIACRIGFVLVLIYSTLQIVSQVTKSKISYKTRSSEWIFARPGLDVTAERKTLSDNFASDTLSIVRAVTEKGDSIKGIAGNSLWSYKERDFRTYPIDTQILVVNDNYEKFHTVATKGFADGIPMHGVTDYLKAKKPQYVFGPFMETSAPRQTFRVLPASGMQHIIFTLMDLIKLGSILFLCFYAARLCANFSKDEYFTSANIKLLKYGGWLIVLPQVAKLLFYCIYHNNFHPRQELLVDSSYEFTNFTLIPNLQPVEIFFGIGLIILSVGFKKGLLLQTDSNLTI